MWSECTRWATCLVKPRVCTFHVPSVSRLVTNLHSKYITWRNQYGHPQNSELAIYCSGSFTQSPRGANATNQEVRSGWKNNRTRQRPCSHFSTANLPLQYGLHRKLRLFLTQHQKIGLCNGKAETAFIFVFV